MPRLIFITVLLLNICACGLVPEAPVDPKEKARQAAEAQAWYEQRLKVKAEWPEKFFAMIMNPNWGESVHAWRKPDETEMGQSGEFTFSWKEEDVSYPTSSSSWKSIYDKDGYYAGSYEVQDAPAAPIRTLYCEIHLLFGEIDGETVITNARYGGPYCHIYFPIP